MATTASGSVRRWFCSTLIRKYKNSTQYENEINEYQNKIENYANEVNKMDLTNTEIFMKVMDDMWGSIIQKNQTLMKNKKEQMLLFKLLFFHQILSFHQ